MQKAARSTGALNANKTWKKGQREKKNTNIYPGLIIISTNDKYMNKEIDFF